MDKKLSTAAAAFVGALIYGGAELFDINERLTALEEAHPEVTAEPPAEDPEPEAEPEAEPEPETEGK